MNLESKIKLGHFDKELEILRDIADEAYLESKIEILKQFCASDFPVLKDKSFDDKKEAVSSLNDRCDISSLLNSGLDVNEDILSVLSLFGYDNPIKINSSHKDDYGIVSNAPLLSKILGIKTTRNTAIIKKTIFSKLYNNDFSVFLQKCYDGCIKKFVSDISHLVTIAKKKTFNLLASSSNFDKYYRDILRELDFDNPIKLSTSNFRHSGRFISTILGINPTQNSKVIKRAIFGKLYNNDFSLYLNQCYDGKVSSMSNDLNQLFASSKSFFFESIIPLKNFSDYRYEFMKILGYSNPIYVTTSGDHNIDGDKWLVSKILGFKSEKNSSFIRKAIFKEFYDNDFKSYLDSCYAGNFQCFFTNLKNLFGSSKSAFLEDILSLNNSGNLKKALLVEFGYNNPMNICTTNDKKTGMDNIGSLVKGILELKNNDSVTEATNVIFNQLHENDFNVYLHNVYDGNFSEFIQDFMKLKPQKKQSFLDTILNLSGFSEHKIDFLKEFGYDNPINVTSRNKLQTGTQSIGSFIRRFLGIKSNKSPSTKTIQKSIFKQLYHDDFQFYLDTCYSGDIKSFKKEFDILGGSTKNAFWNSLTPLMNFSKYKDLFNDSTPYYKDFNNVEHLLNTLIKATGTFPKSHHLAKTHPYVLSAITMYHGGFSAVKIKLGYADKELDILKQVVGEVYDGS